MTQTKDGRLTTSVLCAALFLSFGYALLAHYQESLLATAQWVMSDYRTHYLAVASPIVLLVLLTIIALVVERIVRPITSAYALVYAPSLWLLALLTDITLPMPSAHSNGFTWIGMTIWGVALCIALWGVALATPRQGTWRNTSMASTLCSNLAILTTLFTLTALASNTCAHVHNTTQMSHLARHGRYAEMLQVGQSGPETNRSLSAMRAYALSRTSQLPELLFAYPQHDGALGLIPPAADSSYTYHWPRRLYAYLGTACTHDIDSPDQAIRYLRITAHRHSGRKTADYLLCALLLERRLDEFATELPHHYPTTEPLPRHYREALALRAHLAPANVSPYALGDTPEHLAAFMQRRESHTSPSAQQHYAAEQFPDTYWRYYYSTE